MDALLYLHQVTTPTHLQYRMNTMKPTKKSANEIANNAVAELGGDWQNKVFQNADDWCVNIYSPSLDMTMVFSSGWNSEEWSAYSDLDNGFLCSGKTPTETVKQAVRVYTTKIGDLQAIMDTYRNRIEIINS